MKLFCTLSSPFTRKVLVLAHELDLQEQLEIEYAHPFEDGNTLPMINPLRKVPALMLDEPLGEMGRLIIDSPVICEYLSSMQKDPAEIPSTMHLMERTLEAISDGIMDVSVARTLEKRRPPSHQIPAMLQRHADNIHRTLKWLEDRPGLLVVPEEDPLRIGVIALGCALSYLGFRHEEMKWESSYPSLLAFYTKIKSRKSFQCTELKDTS